MINPVAPIRTPEQELNLSARPGLYLVQCQACERVKVRGKWVAKESVEKLLKTRNITKIEKCTECREKQNGTRT